MAAQAPNLVDVEALRVALDRGEFELHFQPQIELDSGRMSGVEALLRWRHPRRGLLSPNAFVAVAESSGLILPLGEWALNAACTQARAWEEAGRALSVAVNVSARQIDRNFPETVARVLRETGLTPMLLELEITESIAMDASPATAQLLARLRDLGVRLAIDDFGTGYSCLSHLRCCPVSTLKIDMSFVREICSDHPGRTIVRAIIGLAHGLGMEAIAEGVETAETLAALRELGCDKGQGYLFSPPVPADAVPFHQGTGLDFGAHSKV
jgi:EAL domain-containing protein (putative c-di-GMP-specific phosphodiesterase class I)